MQFSYGDNDLFGFNGGWGHIEGKTPDRCKFHIVAYY